MGRSIIHSRAKLSYEDAQVRERERERSVHVGLLILFIEND